MEAKTHEIKGEKVGVIEKGKKKVLPRPCVKIGKTAFSWIAKRKKSTRLKVRTNI